MAIESRQVCDFDRVRFRGPGTLKIMQSDRESLSIHAPRYVMDDIVSRVERGELTLGYQPPKIVPLMVHKEVISYELRMKDINSVELSGLGRVLIPDVDTDHLRLVISGGGSFRVNQLTADNLTVLISGTGTMRLTGDVETQKVKITGAGNLHSSQLISDFSDIHIEGAGTANVAVADTLSVVISGAGVVTYRGYPEIVKSISGAGRVVRDRKQRAPEKGQEHG